ncbi:MAG: glutamine amidotransferase [Chloroflexota bacterium]|nr:glutamine amidotransferase [Chloroflexota bacterium]
MMELREAAGDAPEVLFLGEGSRDGYVEGALRTAFRVTKLHSGQALAGSDAETRVGECALVVLTDYPSSNLSAANQEAIAGAVERGGRGLLMIGGWASFGGPRGGYYGSRIAELLPVEIGDEDDRVNSPLGTVLVTRRERHPAISSIHGQEPCAVMGYNGVRVRHGADVLIEGQRLRIDGDLRPRLEKSTTPVLSVWQRGAGRVGALAPDVMPHWAGGIVDWGERRVALPTGNEVGHLYPAFLVDVCQWLAGVT